MIASPPLSRVVLSLVVVSLNSAEKKADLLLLLLLYFSSSGLVCMRTTTDEDYIPSNVKSSVSNSRVSSVFALHEKGLKERTTVFKGKGLRVQSLEPTMNQGIKRKRMTD